MAAPIKVNKTDNRQTNKLKWEIDPALPVYISGFLDLFGVSMILPLISGHCRSLGASLTVTGILGSFYGAIQLFSSPLVGQRSDVGGRRFILLVCLFMSACSYSMMFFATSMTVVFMTRAPLGIFKHSQNIEKSYLTNITPSHRYTHVLGYFNAASSVGFILGPVVGGHLADKPGGFYMVALLTGSLFFFNFGMMWLLGPEAKPSKTETLRRNESSATSLKKLASDENNFNYESFWTSAKRLDWSDLWDLYLIKFLGGAAVIIFRSNFRLMLVQMFDASSVTIGYIISFGAIISTVSGFLSAYILKFYQSNATVMLHLNVLKVITMLCLSLSSNLWLFILAQIPLAVISTLARVASTSLTIERGSKEMAGLLMGLQQSCMSVARMLAPLISGMALEISSSGPGLISACLSTLVVIIMLIWPQDPRDRKKKHV